MALAKGIGQMSSFYVSTRYYIQESKSGTFEVVPKNWDANPRIFRKLLLLRKISPRIGQRNTLPFSDQRTLWHYCNCWKYCHTNRPSQRNVASHTFQGVASQSRCKWFLRWLCAAWFSILQRRRQICRLLYLTYGIAAKISILVSLCTITAVSVDRLLALLLKIRYRQVVTLRKVYTVATASWICSGIGFAPLWYFSPDRWIIPSVIVVAVCLIISTYCYSRIFFRLRHQHTQVHKNLPEEENQTTRVDITRYRKTVSSALWLR